MGKAIFLKKNPMLKMCDLRREPLHISIKVHKQIEEKNGGELVVANHCK